MAEYKLDPTYVIDTGLMYIVYYERGPHRAVAILLDANPKQPSCVPTSPYGAWLSHPGGTILRCCAFVPYSGNKCAPVRFIFEEDEPELYEVFSRLLIDQVAAGNTLVYHVDADVSDTLQVSTKDEDEELNLHVKPEYRALEAKVVELTTLFANSRTTDFTLLEASNYVIERIRAFPNFYEMLKDGEIDKLELIDYVEECLDDTVEAHRLAKVGKNVYSHV